MSELSTKFNFKDVETKWLNYWEENRVFHAEPNPKKKPYAIVIPPPNVTGILHMGHALNNTLQDILIRYKRMQGFEACWMPGTDHAGIATQNVVEKQLAKEGKTRHDLGREEMLKRLWEWKHQYGDTIIKQLKKLGSSCDWQRTRFTMDEQYSRAIQHVFVTLYEKGLIYRGKYIINWCPRCQTALSDEEAEHREQQGALYYIHYSLLSFPSTETKKEHIVVATTRPETMLGDTAVAVNPSDERYKHLIGKKVILPLVEREIPIIADELVDPAFGTGAVKVTPAHDPNDFVMGERHHLEFINILHPDGRLNENAGEFAGMDRFEGREAVIESLKNLKLLEKVDQHTHAVGHCYRCHTVVEPYLSKQWFVKMKPLAQPAVKVVESGQVKFTPERWAKVYLNWMENIRDWCISRQIWWGHRIPVWYCQGCTSPDGEATIIVAKETPAVCPKCKGKNLKQDEDVLDTWFSSWLWPFATFGWPENKKDTNYFYPTNALFTASEIIFFWVARMIMAGMEFMGKIPFSDVYIHGTVRDAQGRKMSKSLGNALDPLEIIDEYGADALRFSLIINSGQDLYIAKEKFEVGRNFANKIWNATRLVLMNTQAENHVKDFKTINIKHLDLPTRWIVSRFYSTLVQVTRAIESYRFSEAESLIYDFFWGNFCDWYLEIVKNKFSDKDIQQVTFLILKESIAMIHPFMPFVTEEIWGHLCEGETILSLQAWPVLDKKLIDDKSERDMGLLIEFVSAVRNLKVQWNIPAQQEIECLVFAEDDAQLKVLQMNAEILKFLSRINDLSWKKDASPLKDAATGVVGTIRFYLPLQGVVDITKEKNRMLKQTQEYQRAADGISQRLKNSSFVQKAPPEVVEKDRERLMTLQAKTRSLEDVIKSLS